jgi:hypothetical protein
MLHTLTNPLADDIDLHEFDAHRPRGDADRPAAYVTAVSPHRGYRLELRWSFPDPWPDTTSTTRPFGLWQVVETALAS